MVYEFFTQRVNQWLGILLLLSITFWTVLYYFTNKAQAIAENFSSEQTIYLEK